MKFGMNLLLWTDDPTQESFFPVLEKLKKLGFDGVELPVFNLDIARWQALGKKLDALGWTHVRQVAHATLRHAVLAQVSSLEGAVIRRYRLRPRMKLDLHDLNPPQRAAVLHGEGPLLVLAGACSDERAIARANGQNSANMTMASAKPVLAPATK